MIEQSAAGADGSSIPQDGNAAVPGTYHKSEATHQPDEAPHPGILSRQAPDAARGPIPEAANPTQAGEVTAAASEAETVRFASQATPPPPSEAETEAPIAAVQAETVVTPAVKVAQEAKSEALSEGVVRKIDAANGKITLKHGPLVDLAMPAMTMVFKVQPPNLLNAVKVGDTVKFRAENLKGALTVTAIEPGTQK